MTATGRKFWNVDTVPAQAYWATRHRVTADKSATVCGLTVTAVYPPDGAGPECTACYRAELVDERIRRRGDTSAHALPPVADSLAETFERARRRNEPLFQLDEIESPDRCVELRYGTAWVWADFRDGKRREVNANYPRGFDTSTEAFADYAAALQDFGR